MEWEKFYEASVRLNDRLGQISRLYKYYYKPVEHDSFRGLDEDNPITPNGVNVWFEWYSCGNTDITKLFWPKEYFDTRWDDVFDQDEFVMSESDIVADINDRWNAKIKEAQEAKEAATAQALAKKQADEIKSEKLRHEQYLKLKEIYEAEKQDNEKS